MIGLGQEDEIEEITLQPEIWRHDTVYHEADHCMKSPHSANVRILWSWLAKGAVVLWTSCLNYSWLHPILVFCMSFVKIWMQVALNGIEKDNNNTIFLLTWINISPSMDK